MQLPSDKTKTNQTRQRGFPATCPRKISELCLVIISVKLENLLAGLRAIPNPSHFRGDHGNKELQRGLAVLGGILSGGFDMRGRLIRVPRLNLRL